MKGECRKFCWRILKDQVVIIAGALGVWPISVDHLRINNDNPGRGGEMA